MEELVNKVLRKTKKPIPIDKIYSKVENLIRRDNPEYEGLSDSDKEEINRIVSSGVESYKYIKTTSENYIPITKTSFKVGRFYGNKNGEGQVVVSTVYTNKFGKTVEDKTKYFIDRDSVNKAIDGDIVLIDTYQKKNSNLSFGKVDKIIERDLDNIVGIVTRIGNSYFVEPVDKKKKNLKIAIEGEAIEGQRVAVSLNQKTSDDFYIGSITRTFGHKDEPDSDSLWEAFKCGINDQFSKYTQEEVKSIPQHVRDMDKVGRDDLTGWEIYTIDGKDTKDVDDALSYMELPNGNILVGVHIADVSHYVKEDSYLEKDAFSRGTSVYLSNKVIPMLPCELSNCICSLNPGVERLAFSDIVEFDSYGNKVSSSRCLTVIKSNMKMNYDDVNDLLDDNIVHDGYESHVDSLKGLYKLALILRRNRLAKGAIEFNRPELKAIVDDDGKVEGFSVRTQGSAEMIVEEMMLMANEDIATVLYDAGIPCLYRVHDVPNYERLQDFLNLLDAIGYNPNKFTADGCCKDPKKLQELAIAINEMGSVSNMLSTNLIRCMSRAKYTPINIGHSGLAKENYCHFTSPIRRYPDLTIHRILKDCILDKSNLNSNKAKWKEKLPEIGLHSSKKERDADQAEEEVLAMKVAEYMQSHIGEDYLGTVIGINEKGLQIQLDNYLEGKVRFRNLSGEYFYNPDTYSLLSLNGRDDYYIGDRLSVKVVGADKERKTVDFKVNEKVEENKLKNVTSKNNYVKLKVKEDRQIRKLYNIK